MLSKVAILGLLATTAFGQGIPDYGSYGTSFSMPSIPGLCTPTATVTSTIYKTSSKTFSTTYTSSYSQSYKSLTFTPDIASYTFPPTTYSTPSFSSHSYTSYSLPTKSHTTYSLPSMSCNPTMTKYTIVYGTPSSTGSPSSAPNGTSYNTTSTPAPFLGAAPVNGVPFVTGFVAALGAFAAFLI